VELENLAFVPPAVRSIPGYPGPYADCTLEHALLVDRFEVTRGDWLFYAGGSAAAEGDAAAARWQEVGAHLAGETSPGAQGTDRGRLRLDWPATWMTRVEARAFAAQRGMRLPTAREWVHVAVGRSMLRYPYGTNSQVAWANTAELGLGELASVGTFESGRSSSGCYDLLGNAAEWVDGWLPGHDESLFEAGPDGSFGPEGEACAFGGSYRELTRPTFRPYLEFNAVTLDPGHRGDDLGLRCAADAAQYLWERAGDWRGADAERRVAAVARGWAETVGREPVARLLEELAARPGAPEPLRWLLEGAR
jgi:formylglycine-generating enzyme required for sulfatase activity